MTAVDDAIQLTEHATGLNFTQADLTAARAQLANVSPEALTAYNTNVRTLLQQNHNQALPNAGTQLATAAKNALHSAYGLPANIDINAGNTAAITTAFSFDVVKVNSLRVSGTAFESIGGMIQHANNDHNYPRLAAAAPPASGQHGGQGPGQRQVAQGGSQQQHHGRRRHGVIPPPPPPPADASGDTGGTGGDTGAGSGGDAGAGANASGGDIMSTAMQMLPGLIQRYGIGPVLQAGVQTIMDFFQSSGGGGIMGMLTGQGGQRAGGGQQFDFMGDFTRNLTAAAQGQSGAGGAQSGAAGGAAPPTPDPAAAPPPTPDPAAGPPHAHGTGRHQLRTAGGQHHVAPPPPPPPPPAPDPAAAARQREAAAADAARRRAGAHAPG